VKQSTENRSSMSCDPDHSFPQSTQNRCSRQPSFTKHIDRRTSATHTLKFDQVSLASSCFQCVLQSDLHHAMSSCIVKMQHSGWYPVHWWRVTTRER